MKRLIKDLVFKSVSGMNGKKFFQPIWKNLFRLSMAGMNIGKGDRFWESGEIWVLKYLGVKLAAKENIIIFDIGAHEGLYTLEILKLLGDKITIYCFEPAKNAFKTLCGNVGKYKNVHPLNLGLSDKEGSAALYDIEEKGTNRASLYRRELSHYGFSMRYQETANLVRLDDFCKEAQIGHIDFLKLDIEGHELKVLKGSRGLINSGAIDYIQFEFNECNVDSRTYFRDFFYFLNERYRIFRIIQDGLVPIDDYDISCEIFFTTNYLAIIRTKPDNPEIS